MFLSVFDVFKIGVGPSSSHTMGPMSAANRFLDLILSNEWPRPSSGAQVASIKASLHGSLAYTGIGHGTGRAVILGLMGEAPDSVDPDKMDGIIDQVERSGRITPPGHPAYFFLPKNDLIFDKKQTLPGHANGMIFSAFDKDERLLLKRIYYSVGGGFVVTDTELEQMRAKKKAVAGATKVPYPFATAAQMLEMADRSGLTIAQMKRANEESQRSREELDVGLDKIWEAMRSCIERGLKVDGIMPGGLKVRRRARQIHDKLQEEWRSNRINPLLANDWLSVYAMAVNEENAAGGRVVTAPTNGAAGVLPAVIKYYETFVPGATKEGTRTLLMTAAAIGFLYKTNASISAAEMGCQGEVGVACSMAAAGLCAALGGTPGQIENAAEIGMEHNLGLTCDPIGGLVQVPCIERNTMGAIKAINATYLALNGDGHHIVSLDAVIETMRQTGEDMRAKYKETSLGGLAVNVVEC